MLKIGIKDKNNAKKSLRTLYNKALSDFFE